MGVKEKVKKIFRVLWEWIRLGIISMVVVIAIIFGCSFLMALAESATLGFGIAVAGIAIGVGMCIGFYFISRNKKRK